MSYKLKLINKVFYLLTDKLAKEGEYALTATGICKKVDLDKVTLWEDGCCQVIGCSDRKFSLETGLAIIGQELKDKNTHTEWRCDISGWSDYVLVLSNVTPTLPNSIDYLEWVKWMQCEGNEKHCLPPMTNSKARFAEKLLSDKELLGMMENVGVLSDVFESIYYYMKHRN